MDSKTRHYIGAVSHRASRSRLGTATERSENATSPCSTDLSTQYHTYRKYHNGYLGISDTLMWHALANENFGYLRTNNNHSVFLCKKYCSCHLGIEKAIRMKTYAQKIFNNTFRAFKFFVFKHISIGLKENLRDEDNLSTMDPPQCVLRSEVLL